MSPPRFYLDQPLAPGARFNLPAGPARHAVRALRLAVDDAITLFNGRGGEYAARIERIQKDEVTVSVTGFADVERESRLHVRLAQGISSGERMDYTLQKAVELGVAAIQPIAAKRSVVKLAGERADKRVAHWQGVVASACEQCGRNRVPVVASPMTLANWLGQHEAGRLLFLSPTAEARLADLSSSTAQDWLVAGPEGALRPMKSLHCMQQAPFRSDWDRAYCVPRRRRWPHWRRCKRYGVIFKGMKKPGLCPVFSFRGDQGRM